jgi:hypothetical protein
MALTRGGTSLISYEELAVGLEEAWLLAGLHEHAIVESIQPGTLDRVYRAELFPEHPEPIGEGWSPPWVELNLVWTAAHQLFSEGRDITPGPLELAWTYTVDVRSFDRSDVELLRAFNSAVRAALRRVMPDFPPPADYIAVEIRRGYRIDDKPSLVYLQIVGTNVTDLSDLWGNVVPKRCAQCCVMSCASWRRCSTVWGKRSLLAGLEVIARWTQHNRLLRSHVV